MRFFCICSTYPSSSNMKEKITESKLELPRDSPNPPRLFVTRFSALHLSMFTGMASYRQTSRSKMVLLLFFGVGEGIGHKHTFGWRYVYTQKGIFK